MKSLGTALRVLEQFADTATSFSVQELADRCSLAKSQVSKILSTFREQGFVIQDPLSRRYSVGLQLYILGSRYTSSDPLAREALPVLRELVDATGHSARLSIVHNDNVHYLAAVEGRLLFDSERRVGARLAWHAAAAARAILAFVPREEQERMLDKYGLPAITQHTITDRARLDKVLRRIRKEGYATVRNESTLGLSAVAVPVLGAQQTVIAAMSLTFPEHIVTSADEPRLASALFESARKLSLRMGSPVYSIGATVG